MMNPSCYKKPTPTDIIYVSELDFLSRALFREVFTMCRNESGTEVFWHGNKQFTVSLYRGQMILRVANIAKELGISKSKVSQRLNTINKVYTEMLIEGRPFGSVITLKDYDSLIEMKSKSEPDSQSKNQRKYAESATSNNSVKSDKTVYINKKNSSNKVDPLERLISKCTPTLSLQE